MLFLLSLVCDASARRGRTQGRVALPREELLRTLNLPAEAGPARERLGDYLHSHVEVNTALRAALRLAELDELPGCPRRARPKGDSCRRTYL